MALVFMMSSSLFAAPPFSGPRPEPVEKPGLSLRQRLTHKASLGLFPATPLSYPASIKLLFLRVDFQQADPLASKTTGNGLWTSYAQGTPANANDPDDPAFNFWVNRAKTKFIDYWKEVSYGLLDVQIAVSTKVYRLPQPMSFYGNETPKALENLIYDSVTVASAETDTVAKIDFTLYDAILIVHAGSGEESDVHSDSANDLWSLYYSIDGASGCITPGAQTPQPDQLNCLFVSGANGTNKKITEAIIMPQTDSQDGLVIDPLGVYVHEFGHWLGLPDLYCTAGMICFLDGVGKWSLMGDGIYNYDANDSTTQSPGPSGETLHWYGSSPAHPDAWSKVFLGWVSPLTTVPPEDRGNHVFAPMETASDIVKIQASSSTSQQYFLLENRQQMGFDKGLPGHGLLIWLIDDSVVNNNLYANSVNNSRFRPGVKLIEADNDWKLLSYGCTAPDDCGSAGDPFPGSTNNTSFTLHSTPASTAYTPFAWVSVRNIVETGAATITADIGFAPFPPTTPGMFGDTLSWPSSTDQTITGYNVYKNGVQVGQAAGLSFRDPSARNGDVYQITAVDKGSDESDFSGLLVANMATGNGGSGDPRCFIATAAYGSSWEPHVMALREFRDHTLLTNGPGRAFVRFYYRHSTPMADFIGRHEMLRAMTRWTLTPIVYAMEYPVMLVLLFLCSGIALAMAGRRVRAK